MNKSHPKVLEMMTVVGKLCGIFMDGEAEVEAGEKKQGMFSYSSGVLSEPGKEAPQSLQEMVFKRSEGQREQQRKGLVVKKRGERRMEPVWTKQRCLWRMRSQKTLPGPYLCVCDSERVSLQHWQLLGRNTHLQDWVYSGHVFARDLLWQST